MADKKLRLTSALSVLSDFIAKSIPVIEEMAEKGAVGTPPSHELIDAVAMAVLAARRQLDVIDLCCRDHDYRTGPQVVEGTGAA